MEYYRHHALSCGVIQITGLMFTDRAKLKNAFLNSYMDACKDRAMHPGHDILMFSTAIFSDNNYGNGPILGEKLAKLGEITQSPFRVNPNSGNRIAVWTWNPSQETMAQLKRHIKSGYRYAT